RRRGAATPRAGPPRPPRAPPPAPRQILDWIGKICACRTKLTQIRPLQEGGDPAHLSREGVSARELVAALDQAPPQLGVGRQRSERGRGGPGLPGWHHGRGGTN